ncbi:unnamed protein product, partial [Didymodactylos carnosus]
MSTPIRDNDLNDDDVEIINTSKDSTPPADGSNRISYDPYTTPQNKIKLLVPNSNSVRRKLKFDIADTPESNPKKLKRIHEYIQQTEEPNGHLQPALDFQIPPMNMAPASTAAVVAEPTAVATRPSLNAIDEDQRRALITDLPNWMMPQGKQKRMSIVPVARKSTAAIPAFSSFRNRPLPPCPNTRNYFATTIMHHEPLH